jgi:ketosteroid isomerase-like protein
MEPLEIFCAFISEINNRDVDALCALMTEDHTFVDSLGNVFNGRETMRNGWTQYFALFPDYRIACEEFFKQGNTIAAVGSASATYAPNGEMLERNRWVIPAAFRAVIENGQVKEWQVYADNEPVRQIMAEAKGQ